MISLPDLTPELLEELGRELGECDFTDPNQIAFLSALNSCDVQAAPGNGKTTLLVAKLALLSRNWTSRQQGVCVISHTNAARDEVEKKLHGHPTAFAFLGYPHFVGTVTTFIDKYIALPYLRGLGWSVRKIDDEHFSLVAKSAYPGKPTLLASARAQNGVRRHQVEGWVQGLELHPEFDAQPHVPLTRLQVRQRPRQPGPASNSGIELEQLKADLVGRGFYRFSDMTALAVRALDLSPNLADRVRRRFPMVLLDEAQDTNGAHLELLERLFGNNAVAYQRLGDQNQTLYEDGDADDRYWTPQAGAIPLNATRRFGQDIAGFASRLTVRVQQNIDGRQNYPSRRTLILFDQPTIQNVLPAYGAEVVEGFAGRDLRSLDVRAVASRHNLYRDQRGGWPKSLVDYCPTYRSGAGQGVRPNGLCGAMRSVAQDHSQERHPHHLLPKLSAAIAEFLDEHGIPHPSGGRFTASNVWRSLALTDHGLPLRIRRAVITAAMKGRAAWEEGPWNVFVEELRGHFGIDPAAVPQRATAYCAYEAEGTAEAVGDVHSQVEHHGVRMKLGSVHSVKGRTVDALLLVESEVFRSAGSRRMDLETVLPNAFGVTTRDLSANDAERAAATNVFVAITRPRQLLSIAVRKSALSNQVLAAANEQGWVVRDLTGQQAR
jgi:hypothetical protein